MKITLHSTPPAYGMDGPIHVWDTATFHVDPKLPDTRLHEIPEEQSQGADTEIDFAIVEMLMKRRQSI